ASLALQALNFAQETDGDLPNDNGAPANPSGTVAISVIHTGVAIVPSTGAITFGQIVKDLILKGLVTGIVEGRGYAFPTVLTTTELSSVAALIEAAYDIFAQIVTQPITIPNTIHNQLITYGAFAGGFAGALVNSPALLNGGGFGDPFVLAIIDGMGEMAFGVDTGV